MSAALYYHPEAYTTSGPKLMGRVLRIPDGEVLEGDLPGRQMKLVQAWIELHQDDLMADWLLVRISRHRDR